MTRSLKIVFVTVNVLLASSVLVASEELSQRIFGGHETDIEDAPWMAAIWTNNKDGNISFCGGSIVHEQFILTAAHCFRNAEEPLSSWAYIGLSNLMDEDGVYVKPEQTLCHEEFTFPDHANDICLIKLKDPITEFNDKIALITFDDIHVNTGTMVNVTGWGKTENSKGAVEDLRQVLVPLISDKACRKSYPSTTEKQICAGNKGHDSCVGDSGGPLTWYNIQIGIVSYGRGCGQPNGAVYTKVTKYLDWISSTINDNL